MNPVVSAEAANAVQDAFTVVIFVSATVFTLWMLGSLTLYLWRTRHRINRRRHTWPRTAGHPDFFSQHRRVEADQE